MHKKNKKEIIELFNTNEEKGLSKEEVKKRLLNYGENRLQEGKQDSFLKLFLNQFKSVLIAILIAAAVISISIGESTEGIVILVIILLNSLIGAKQEKSAGDAVKALRNMSSPNAKVLREGNIIEIESSKLVPGDVVLLEAGSFVPADLRLIETINLKIEESALTGESVPVEKDAEIILEENVPLSERFNLAYMGTVVTYGRGTGIVTATGMNTEFGKIAKMLEHDQEQTPLQKKLEKLGKMLGIACIAVCIAVFILGYIRGIKLMEIFMISISLAVAAVPEGLPAIVTVILAIGMQRMVKRNVLTKNLSSVETLGSTTIICSDKTGTLTQNKMNVKKVFDGKDELNVTGNGYSAKGQIGQNYDTEKINMLLSAAVLCNDSELKTDEEGIIGDPTEGALLVLGAKGGLNRKEMKEKYPRLKEYPFDSERKMMSTLHNIDGKYIMLTKGAPDSIISNCTKIIIDGQEKDIGEYKQKLKEINDKWSQEALRVLAYSYKELRNENGEWRLEEEENNLVFAGLTGMIDPPREEVKDAIKKCKSAGIRVVMITGDNAITAAAIGREIGLLEKEAEAVTGNQIDEMNDTDFIEKVKTVNVFSRVSPEHKVKIVDALKQNGEITAMTGDGVNDAPSLKKSDIGIAMGITGTDVSKEAADMILTDDNFVSIVGAVEEGRVIFANIRKFVGFLISCNVGEIIMIFTSMLFRWGSPLLPIQLLWVNLITDSLPAFALGLEGKEADVMNAPPRDPDMPIVDKQMRVGIVFQSIALAGAALISYRYGYSIDPNLANTFAFLTLISGELLRAFSGRSETQSLFKIGLFGNKFLNISVLVSYGLTALLLFIPFFRNIFEIQLLTGSQLVIAFVISLIPFIAGEISKKLKM